MKVLIYNIDEGGFKTYSTYLFDAMKKTGFDVTYSDKMDYKNYDLVHIMFDYSKFQPFGLGVIPMLVKLKLNHKKIVLTFGVVPKKTDIYARNKLFTFIKRMVLPITNKLLSLFCDKLVVMLDELKTALVKDYRIDEKNIAVIYHGMY